MRDNFPAEKKEDTEVKDEFKYFPIGYFSHMYFVLCVGGLPAWKISRQSMRSTKKYSLYRDEESREIFMKAEMMVSLAYPLLKT